MIEYHVKGLLIKSDDYHRHDEYNFHLKFYYIQLDYLYRDMPMNLYHNFRARVQNII